MNPDHLDWLVCPLCRSEGLTLLPYDGATEAVREGRVDCPGCGGWFRLENGILDLSPLELRSPERHEAFAQRHGLDTAAGNGAPAKQAGVFEDVADYERRVVNSPFYRALDRIAFHDWARRQLRPGMSVLDIGCGTGRQCLPLARQGIHSVSLDVCEDMVVLARRKLAAENLERQVDLIVADGHDPPVRDGWFDACVAYGVLHHVAKPALAVSNAAHKLVDGGFFYSLEPHSSSVRFVFDWLMRVLPLYVEEASEDPLISEAKMREWLSAAGLGGETRLSTYLPPHLFVMTPLGLNVALLKLTDALLSRIPGLRKMGGVIIAEARKAGPPS